MTAQPDDLKLSRKALAADVRERAERAMTAELNKFDTDMFAKKIISDLNAQRDQVIWKILGLENRFGEWYVDHCNGRNSPITQYLTENIQPLIDAWMREALVEVLKDKEAGIRKFAVKAVQEEVKRTMSYAARDFARRAVDQHVSRIVQEVVTEVMADAVAP